MTSGSSLQAARSSGILVSIDKTKPCQNLNAKAPYTADTSYAYQAVEVLCYHTLFVCRTFPLSETQNFCPGRFLFQLWTVRTFSTKLVTEQNYNSLLWLLKE